jgi:hypothetical protein
MAELEYKSMLNCVTLKGGTEDGKITVEVWYENKIVANWFVEWVWDFVGDVLREAGQDGNVYIDKGRRFRQMVHSYTLPELL